MLALHDRRDRGGHEGRRRHAVEVDLETKLVRVSGDGFAGEDVIAAIDEAGYDAQVAA